MKLTTWGWLFSIAGWIWVTAQWWSPNSLTREGVIATIVAGSAHFIVSLLLLVIAIKKG